MDNNNLINRRDFIKGTLGAFAGIYLVNPLELQNQKQQIEFPDFERLGRLCAGGEGTPIQVKAKPSIYSENVGTIYFDEIVPWHREVVANSVDYSDFNQRWVESDKGYIYSAYVQPVRNLPNNALTELPKFGENPGMWVEITVPIADLILTQPPSGYWLRTVNNPRVYYGQIFWCDNISQGEGGQILYRLSEKVGSFPDFFYARAEACRLIPPEEMTVLSPDIEDKKIIVNLTRQTLSAYENGREVYFCRVATGPKLSEGWSTPPGDHPIWRKLVSLHMSANASKGEAFDTSGIGWTTLFTSDGAAIHAAFWHNEFGKARSHGCVNCLPEDAKWIWRWTLPNVAYDPGDVIIKGMNSSSRVTIVEG
jgi:hypothetical protein